MCCFSRPVKHVSATRIFARRIGGDRQALVYSMSLDVREELAMVLPLPVAAGTGESDVCFVDLSAYPRFFDDLLAAFPPLGMLPAKLSRSFGPAPRAQPLVVHDVGDFEASFVPTIRDFDRLDPRFRLETGVWDAMPGYADHGFAVFRLRPRSGFFGATRKQTVHPMAFSFPTRSPDSVFFPTVHVHDGRAPERAAFDHTLVLQDDGVVGGTIGWTRSLLPLGGAGVDAARTGGLVDGTSPGYAEVIEGDAPNEDIWLRPPTGLSLDVSAGGGERHRYRVCATAAYRRGEPYDARDAAWRHHAGRVGAFAPRFRDALAAWVASEGDSLRLAPIHDGLRPHFINGTKLWTGTSYVDGRAGHDGGAGFVTFRPFTDDLEPQEVVLGFSALPDEETTDRIHGCLRDVIDRSLAAR